MKLSDCDAVILCGGEGSRIRHLLPEGYPKIMVEVNGTPFFDILIERLVSAGLRRFIFATGYGHDLFVQHSGGPKWIGYNFEWIPDKQPRGTGGAVRNVLKKTWSQSRADFLIINGDTYCDVDCAAMLDYHLESKSVITVAHDDQMRHVGTFAASRRLIHLIPETDGKYDMEELFTLLGKKHEPVGWFRTEARFWDIGSPEGLEAFRRYNGLSIRKS